MTMNLSETITREIDGITIEFPNPALLPSENRAEALRAAYNEHVTHPDGHWKGRASALVNDRSTAALVIEAMNFMGSLVDKVKETPSGRFSIYSDGYWAHGF